MAPPFVLPTDFKAVSNDELAERVGVALRAIRPEGNRMGWYDAVSELMGISGTGFREQVAGNVCPVGQNLYNLCMLLPDFRHALYGDPEANGDSEFAAEIKAVVEKHQNGA